MNADEAREFVKIANEFHYDITGGMDYDVIVAEIEEKDSNWFITLGTKTNIKHGLTVTGSLIVYRTIKIDGESKEVIGMKLRDDNDNTHL